MAEPFGGPGGARRVRADHERGDETIAVPIGEAPGGVSARNLAALGFESLWDRRLWRFDPVLDREVALEAARLANG